MFERESIVGPLQASVHRRLDDLTRSVDTADETIAANLGFTEIPILVEALRAVLAEHEPDARGRCPACRSRLSRMLFRKRSRTPCRAYLAVQLRLGIGDEPVVPPSTSHHRKRKQHLHYAS
ncbi:hypothetical protein [Amycolatopsis anabasis]|uniref:hypothetical protein n=1 Tax=Amycolatopsis anabasis TaxID=1840409 RepID=UPI00131D11AA|nr:hypothetical protein [Amycolatopsis anabasis]